MTLFIVDYDYDELVSLACCIICRFLHIFIIINLQ